MATLEAAYQALRTRKLAPEVLDTLRQRLTAGVEMRASEQYRDVPRLFVEAAALGLQDVASKLLSDKSAKLDVATCGAPAIVAAVSTGQATFLKDFLWLIPGVATALSSSAHQNALRSAFVRACVLGDLSTAQAVSTWDNNRYLDSSTYNEALCEAAKAGQDKAVEWLLGLPEACGVKPAHSDSEALRIACKKRRRSVVKRLVTAPGVNVALDDNQPLITAASIGDAASLKLLLASPDVDPAARDNEAFIKACENGRLSTVKLLMENEKVDPAARDNLGFRLAVRHNHAPVVNALLWHTRVDPTAPAGTCEAWHAATVMGYTDILQALNQDSRVAAARGVPVEQPGAPAAEQR